MIKLRPLIQKEGFCGPASLGMVLDYYGVHKSQARLGKMARCTRERGARLSNVAEVAQSLGFKTILKDYSTFAEINKYIKKSIPVIVNWYSETYDHYSVVVGIDAKYIYIQDPEKIKPVRMKREKFQELWFGFDLSGRFLQSPKDFTIRRILVIYK